MKKLILKQVPEEEVQKWFLKMRERESPKDPSVPKVIKQYTRKKKDLQTEYVTPTLSATVSDRSHSEVKINENGNIEEKAVTEIGFLNVDIKTEPNPCIDEIKEENVDIDTDQNCSHRPVYVKNENITEIIIPDQNCILNKITEQIEIKVENDDVIEHTNASDCNKNENKKFQPHLQVVNIDIYDHEKIKIVEPMTLKSETIGTKADTAIYISKSVSTNTNNISKTLFSEGTLTQNDGKLTSIINNVKKEPAETNFVESNLNLTKKLEGNGTFKVIKLKKCLFVPFNLSGVGPTRRVPFNVARANPQKVPENQEAASETYTCDACDKRFVTRRGIRIHVQRWHRQRSESARHACTLCPVRFAHYFELLAHMREHYGKPFTCDLCPRRYKSSNYLATHMNTHLRERLYSCPVCLRRFAKQDALDRHVVKHSRADTFDCDACAERFPCAIDLRRHRVDAHGERCLHPCYICSRALPSRTELANHLRGHTDADVECVFCLMHFTDVLKWEEHSAKHVAEFHADKTAPYVRGPHVCRSCRKTFMYKSELATHVIAAHSGRRPYKCGTCSQTCKTRSALTEHENTHVRPFACETCGARFGKRGTLATHARLHTGERPYVCTHCNASFVQRYTLQQHTRRRHMPSLKRARNKRKNKTGSKSNI